MKTTIEYVRQAVALRDEIQQGAPDDWVVTLYAVDTEHPCEGVLIRAQRWDPYWGRQLDMSWLGFEDPGYLRDMVKRMCEWMRERQQEIGSG